MLTKSPKHVVRKSRPTDAVAPTKGPVELDNVADALGGLNGKSCMSVTRSVHSWFDVHSRLRFLVISSDTLARCPVAKQLETSHRCEPHEGRHSKIVMGRHPLGHEKAGHHEGEQDRVFGKHKVQHLTFVFFLI